MKKILLLLALIAAQEGVAHAQAYMMNQAAWGCKPATANNGGSLWDVGFVDEDGDNARIFTDLTVGSGSSTTIYCPLTFYGGSVSTVYASVYDRSSTADVSCTLHVVDSTGATNLWSGTQTTSGSSSSPMLLSWSPSGFTGPAYGLMTCTIPQALAAGVGVLQYSGLTQFNVYP